MRNKGSTPREYLNTLVFLAPDERNLENLLNAFAEKKAWQRVLDERLLLNLTANQENQAASKIENAWNTINIRFLETWSHLIIPYQTEPSSKGALFDKKIIRGGKGSLAERVTEKCIQEDFIFE